MGNSKTVVDRQLSTWYFLYFAFVGTFSPYFSAYLQSLGFGASAIGVLMSLMLAMRIFAPIFWGWFADSRSEKSSTIRWTSFMAMVCFAPLFLASGFWSLFAIIAVMSFFWSGGLPLMEALTLNQLKGIGRDYAHIRRWGSIGFIVAVVLTGVLLDHLEIEAILIVNVVILVFCFLSSLPLPADTEDFPRPVPVSFRRSVFQSKVIALLAAGFFMAVAHSPFYVFFSIHLMNLHYGGASIGAYWAVGVLAEIAVFSMMPRLLRMFSARSILLGCFALAALRFLLIGWYAQVVALLVFAQVLHGATFGAYHASVMAALNRWFPSNQQARIQALYGSLSFGAGGMLGNVASGLIWDSAGPGFAFSFGAMAAMISFAVTWLFWKTGSRNESGAVP